MDKLLSNPISVQLEITSNCNYLCRHCYNYWRYETTGQRHIKEENNIPVILDKIIDADVFHVVVTGGEPLFAFEKSLYAIQKLNENNIKVNMNSNLALLDDKKAKTLKEAGLRHILTSVYSCHKEDNNYQMNNHRALEKTIKGALVAIDNDFSVSTNMVVNKKNFNDVYATGKYLFEQGLSGFNATRFVPAVNSQLEESLSREEVVIMLEQLQLLKDEGYRVGTLNPIAHCFENGKYKELTQNRGCSAGVTSVGIGSNGDVRACQHTPTNYGNILDNSLTDIWASIPHWKENYLPSNCRTCDAASSCGGGCRQYAKIAEGDYDLKDPLYTKPIKNKSLKQITISDSNQKYEVVKNLTARKEKIGGVFFKNPGQYAVVDEVVYHIILKKYHEEFTSENIHDQFHLPLKSARTILGYLERRGILKQQMEAL